MSAIDNSLSVGTLPRAERYVSAESLVICAKEQLSSGTRLAVRLLSALRGGSLRLELAGAPAVAVGDGPLRATWKIKDPSVFDRILAGGDIALGETYMEGLWDADDLSALLKLLADNRAVLKRAVYGRPWHLIGHWLTHLRRANTRLGSRRNIAAHYDLGNDFYALWLDRTMSYSSALFEGVESSLERAQLRKYRRVLERLEAKPGDTILEIGCGWGGFAEVAATEFGCRVLGLTLSREQLDYARQRARRGGFEGAAQFELCDYRDVRGQYDHIVSIEMVEAVGERFWPVWFGQIADRLRPGGRAIIQSITIKDTLFDRYRKGTDFIQRYIFPGGMLPSVGAFEQQARRAGLAVTDDFAFGGDYARTLVRWREAFEDGLDAVHGQGFDERFVRMWRFYLAYCEAGFLSGDIDVHQFELGHQRAA